MTDEKTETKETTPNDQEIARSVSNDLLSADWQPMTTAPRDGTEILLAVGRRAGMPGRCLVGHWMPGGHCIEDHPPIDEGWYFWNGRMFDIASKPTHWMALPAVPSVTDPHRANRQFERKLPNADRDRVGG